MLKSLKRKYHAHMYRRAAYRVGEAMAEHRRRRELFRAANVPDRHNPYHKPFNA
jgi:hypothetical protein